MDEEVRFHLEMEADKLARSEGISVREARRRAVIAFGGVERYKEEVRDARGLDWLAGTRLDFILGLRMLIKHPALTLVGGLGMAVAIAVSVGFFAFIGANVYPVVPLDQGERIIALENRDVEVNNEERQSARLRRVARGVEVGRRPRCFPHEPAQPDHESGATRAGAGGRDDGGGVSGGPRAAAVGTISG